MATIKFLSRFSPTPPPFKASKELREWLREEIDRLATVTNGVLEAVDALNAIPRMFLAGQVDDFNLDTIDSLFVNYTQDGVLGIVPIEPDPVAGTITIPISGVWRMTCYVSGLQPSVTQNEQIRLLVAVNGTPVPIVVIDVATNQTDGRTLAATLTRSFAADDIVTMLMDATADLGIFNILQVSLEMSFVTQDEAQEVFNLNWFP